jgi:NitT/TauT family transport system ATP-binding protein/nitrate/nitrite transport system substrate-binding protein
MSPLRLGLLRLTDSAPILLAQQRGIFARHGVEVSLHIEPSWANIADKLAYGLLDGAVMLPPLALAMAAGLRGPVADIVIPMGISRGGNSITLNAEYAGICGAASNPAAMARLFAAHAATAADIPKLAVVHYYSTHHLMLRDWLIAGGADPDHDVSITVLPPEQVVAALAAGSIAGFCAGAPWGDAAENLSAGRAILGSSQFWPGIPEKCFCLRGGWAAENPLLVTGVLRALREAGRLADTAQNSGAIAQLLYEIGMDLPLPTLSAALAGGLGREKITFAASDISPTNGLWFLDKMQAAGWLGQDIDKTALIARLYRPELVRVA